MEKAYWRKKLPPGFQFWMENLGRSIVFAQPENIYEHAAKYLEQRLMERNMALSRLPKTSYLQKLAVKRRENILDEEAPKDEENEAIIRVDEAKAESAHTFPRTKSLREQPVRSEGAVVPRNFPSPMQLQKTDGDESGRETPVEVSDAVARTLQATQETSEDVAEGEQMEADSQEDAHESHEQTLLLEFSEQSVLDRSTASLKGSRSIAADSVGSQSTGGYINSITALEKILVESRAGLADNSETVPLEKEQSRDLTQTNRESLVATEQCEAPPCGGENQEIVMEHTEQLEKTKSNAVSNVEKESLACDEPVSGPLVLRPEAGPLVPVADHDSSVHEENTDSQNALPEVVQQQTEDGKDEVNATEPTSEAVPDYEDSNEEEQTIEVGAVSTSVEAIVITEDEVDQAAEEMEDNTEDVKTASDVDHSEEISEKGGEDSNNTMDHKIEETSVEANPPESQDEHHEEAAQTTKDSLAQIEHPKAEEPTEETGSLEESVKQTTESKQMIEETNPHPEDTTNGDNTQEIPTESPDEKKDHATEENSTDGVVEENGDVTVEENVTAGPEIPDDKISMSGENDEVTNEVPSNAELEQPTDETAVSGQGCDVTADESTNDNPENPVEGTTEPESVQGSEATVEEPTTEEAENTSEGNKDVEDCEATVEEPTTVQTGGDPECCEAAVEEPASGDPAQANEESQNSKVDTSQNDNTTSEKASVTVVPDAE
ncbi:uncharacterized protein LOC111132574 [Crassostrea virginica]